MEWFALLIPIIGAAGCLFFFQKRLVWWEVILPLLVGVVVIGTGKGCAEYAQTRDTEYWGGYLAEATYYERWDERVSCRHQKYRTESYTYECGTTGKPQTCTGTRQVPDGYEHPYDVDDHPAYWEGIDSNGQTWPLAQGKWESLCGQFGNKAFRDMQRDYHSIDGDAYVTSWRGEWDSMEPVVTAHTYENRIAASDNVLNYESVTEEQAKKEGIYRYPPTSSYSCPSVLSGRTWTGARELEKLNALYGRQHQVRIWLLVFEDASADRGNLQEAYWKRGNKNELVITVGVNKEGVIQWQHVFCWCDDQSIKVDTESYLISGKKLEVAELTQWLKTEIPAKWKRKRFRDFSYVSVTPSPVAMTLIYVLVTVATGGVCFWSVSNEHTSSS